MRLRNETCPPTTDTYTLHCTGLVHTKERRVQSADGRWLVMLIVSIVEYQIVLNRTQRYYDTSNLLTLLYHTVIYHKGDQNK